MHVQVTKQVQIQPQKLNIKQQQNQEVLLRVIKLVNLRVLQLQNQEALQKVIKLVKVLQLQNQKALQKVIKLVNLLKKPQHKLIERTLKKQLVNLSNQVHLLNLIIHLVRQYQEYT